VTEKSRAHYTFGDEGPASERLRGLAEAYVLSSAALDNLRADPWCRERFDETAIDELAEGLEKIAAGEVGGIPIENVLRQVIAAPP